MDDDLADLRQQIADLAELTITMRHRANLPQFQQEWNEERDVEERLVERIEQWVQMSRERLAGPRDEYQTVVEAARGRPRAEPAQLPAIAGLEVAEPPGSLAGFGVRPSQLEHPRQPGDRRDRADPGHDTLKDRRFGVGPKAEPNHAKHEQVARAERREESDQQLAVDRDVRSVHSPLSTLLIGHNRTVRGRVNVASARYPPGLGGLGGFGSFLGFGSGFGFGVVSGVAAAFGSGVGVGVDVGVGAAGAGFAGFAGFVALVGFGRGDGLAVESGTCCAGATSTTRADVAAGEVTVGSGVEGWASNTAAGATSIRTIGPDSGSEPTGAAATSGARPTTTINPTPSPRTVCACLDGTLPLAHRLVLRGTVPYCGTSGRKRTSPDAVRDIANRVHAR